MAVPKLQQKQVPSPRTWQDTQKEEQGASSSSTSLLGQQAVTYALGKISARREPWGSYHQMWPSTDLLFGWREGRQEEDSPWKRSVALNHSTWHQLQLSH